MYNATKSNYLKTQWIKSKNSFVTDDHNNTYIDFTSAIFTVNCGHGAVAEAIKEQVDQVIHCYTFDTPIRTQYLEKLKSFLPNFCDKIYLASAGSEVASWALKLMRAYKQKKTIVHISGAFHGKAGEIGKLENEELFLPFDSSESSQKAIFLDRVSKILYSNKDHLAGIMIETYQGWSARFMDKDYVQLLSRFSSTQDIPLCFDEIQSGFYRTGKKFGYEWYDVEPDLLCLGKSMGGGMPLSGLVGREKYFTFDDMSSTHSGHPVCCAAGLKALEIYESLDQSELDKKAEILKDFLSNLVSKYSNLFSSYESTGLLASLMCKSLDVADKITKQAEKHGLLLVSTGKESIKIGPPLIIPVEVLNRGLKLLKYSVEEISKC